MQNRLPLEPPDHHPSIDSAIHDIYVMRRCVKAWLQEVRLRMLEEQELSQRISEARFRLDGMASSPGGGGSSPRGDARMSEGIGKLMEMERDWSELVSADAKFVDYAMELCRPKETDRYACYLHWAQGLSWSKVARRLNYSEIYVKGKMKDKGVIELYPLIPEEFRRYSLPNAAPG